MFKHQNSAVFPGSTNGERVFSGKYSSVIFCNYLIKQKETYLDKP